MSYTFERNGTDWRRLPLRITQLSNVVT